MSSGSRRKREQKALDALIVWQLRSHGCEGDEIDPDELPELAEEERNALKALGPDYIERLLRGVHSGAGRTAAREYDETRG